MTALAVAIVLSGGLVAAGGVLLALRTPARVAGALLVLAGVSMALAEDDGGKRFWSSPAMDGNTTRLVLENGVLRILRPAAGVGSPEQTLWSSAQS